MLRPPPWFAAEGYTYSSTAVVLQYCTVVLYCCLQQQQTGAGYHTRFEKWGARYLWSAVPLSFGPLQYASFLFVAAVYTSMARSYSYCHLGMAEHLFLWSISYFSKSLRLNFLTASFLSGGRICTHIAMHVHLNQRTLEALISPPLTVGCLRTRSRLDVFIFLF